MSLTVHVNDLITAYKALPNSYWKNKTISHLNDALAASNMIPGQDMGYPTASEPAPSSAATRSTFGQCICRPGVIDKACPTHGGQ